MHQFSHLNVPAAGLPSPMQCNDMILTPPHEGNNNDLDTTYCNFYIVLYLSLVQHGYIGLISEQNLYSYELKGK